MDKKIFIIIGLAVLLICAICGLVFVGSELYRAKDTIGKLAQSVDARDRLIAESERQYNIIKSISDERGKVIAELSRTNSELIRIAKDRQANDRRAIEILGTAIHH